MHGVGCEAYQHMQELVGHECEVKGEGRRVYVADLDVAEHWPAGAAFQHEWPGAGEEFTGTARRLRHDDGHQQVSIIPCVKCAGGDAAPRRE